MRGPLDTPFGITMPYDISRHSMMLGARNKPTYTGNSKTFKHHNRRQIKAARKRRQKK